jgi:hypothetical protein
MSKNFRVASFVYSYYHDSTALVGQVLLIGKVSRLHSDTPPSVGFLWTSDRPAAETFT